MWSAAASGLLIPRIRASGLGTAAYRRKHTSRPQDELASAAPSPPTHGLGGIDGYAQCPLTGCVSDAISVANLLEKNGDGSPNFSVRRLMSNEADVTTDVLTQAINQLFTGGDADIALFYFAGHGIISPEMHAAYIVSQNGSKGSWGVSLGDILASANAAYPKIKTTVIVLDSCNGGFAGEVPGLVNQQVSVVGTGITILTACHRNGTADERNGHGLFTAMLLDALSGSSADICGRITPASVYSHVDQALGPWEQRPVYKANVQTFVTLRQVSPKIPLEILRRLPAYFPDPSTMFALDPSYEPDRQNVPEKFRNLPVNEDHVRMFKELQLCNRHGLVVPVDAEHMYYAAVNSTACKLTALGAHYRMLAEANRI